MRRFAILSLVFLPARLAAGIPTAASLLSLCSALFAVSPGIERVVAQSSYRFVNIADNSGPLKYFDEEVSINNHGAVAFAAVEDDTNARGIFVGNGEFTSTIGHTSGPYSSSSPFSAPDINDDGNVAFFASLDGGGRGVFRSDGDTTTSIAQVGGAAPRGNLYGKPQINEGGTVAFWASIAGMGLGLFRGSGEEAALAADPWPSITARERMSISNDGSVTFINGATRILKVADGVISTVIDGQFLVPVATIDAHSTNSSGTTAFVANSYGGHRAVFTVGGDMVTPIAEYFAALSIMGDSVAINDAGKVAFLARTGSSPITGIYTGDDPVADKVIATGDDLFDSTLVGLQRFIDINNRGDVAFRYYLANGVEGVAVAAVVPEPGAAMSVAPAVVGLLRLVRVRRERLC